MTAKHPTTARKPIDLDLASDVFAAPAELRIPTGGPARKRRNGRRLHPGVVLLKADPARRIGWRARYTDPDTKRTVTESLPRALTTAGQREDFCKRKSDALAERRKELAGGAARATGLPLADAVDVYFRDHPQHAARTLTLYRGSANRFLAWAKDAGIHTADVLDGPALLDFRAAMIRKRKRRTMTGGSVGEKFDTRDLRAPISVNQDLRQVGTILRYLRRKKLLPRYMVENFAEDLERLRLPVKRVSFCDRAELRALLDAVADHDSRRHAVTRAARAAGLTWRKPAPNQPAKHKPLALFFVTAILTGMRLGELLSLTWDRIDLEAGKIHLDACNVKTRHERSVDLMVCPALIPVLRRARPKHGSGLVFDTNRAMVYEVIKRIRKHYGAPAFTMHKLRRTAGTFMTNAPGIFGTASAWCSARQLGHSVQIAERLYAGVIRVDASARTLEAAMGIEQHPALAGVSVQSAAE